MMKPLYFAILGSVPFPNALTDSLLVQNVLYAIRKSAKSPDDIAEDVGAHKRYIEDVLMDLQGKGGKHDLVKLNAADGTWEANIPIFSKEELRRTEEVAKKYGEVEARMLEDAIPQLIEVFGQCDVSQRYEWSEMANVIVGGLVADFCVLDRARFFPKYRREEFLPPLHPDGRRWGYTGYELDEGKVYPTLKWQFYHNFFKDTSGGLARWGYLGERRSSPPPNPEDMFNGDARRIMTELGQKSLPPEEICARTGLPQAFVTNKIRALCEFDPPALMERQGTYSLNLPLLSERDLKSMLAVGDQLAEGIHNEVVLPYLEEWKGSAQELGLKAVLPDITLTREVALQSLIEKGALPSPPGPPVPWNSGVWGWQGDLRMWDELS